MKLFLLILGLLALCSGVIYGFNQLDKWAEAQEVLAVYGYIITDEEAKVVHDYHGILSMKWSIPHKDFIFKRDGEICRARAFEVIKERM